jgi:hypothetical protein
MPKVAEDLDVWNESEAAPIERAPVERSPRPGGCEHIRARLEQTISDHPDNLQSNVAGRRCKHPPEGLSEQAGRHSDLTGVLR